MTNPELGDKVDTALGRIVISRLVQITLEQPASNGFSIPRLTFVQIKEQEMNRYSLTSAS